MIAGRRNVALTDASAWVFNRMVDSYAARPEYPEALLNALCELAPMAGRIGDIGAGIGHLALPLAQRGFQVVAVEPAQAMLEQLQAEARKRAVVLSSLHAAAEALPIETASLDLAVIADALHFIDARPAAGELARVLRRRGVLAIITCEFSDTPFMHAVAEVMAEAAPRRPRAIAQTLAQVSAIVEAPFAPVRRFHDQTPASPALLDDLLRSISYIGPAMHAQRFAAFRARIHALPHPPVWARTFSLYAGTRRAR